MFVPALLLTLAVSSPDLRPPPDLRVADAPGRLLVALQRERLGKDLRECSSDACFAEAERRCLPAHYPSTGVPDFILVDEFVVPSPDGRCRVVTLTDFTELEGGTVERQDCPNSEQRVLDAYRGSECTTTVVHDPRRGTPLHALATTPFAQVRAERVDRNEILFSLEKSGRHWRSLMIVMGPTGPGAMLRSGDQVGRERLRFLEWHPAPGATCAEFEDERGKREQRCYRTAPLGDFGEPRRKPTRPDEAL